MYELKQLQCFVAVGEELPLGRAAKNWHMTQPPLSRQIQMLGRELRIKLLSRTSRTVRLTPAGRAFLPAARRILPLTESAPVAARCVAKGETGLVRLGFPASQSYSFLPRLLALARTSLKGFGVVL